jgi:hypothetical protein
MKLLANKGPERFQSAWKRSGMLAIVLAPWLVTAARTHAFGEENKKTFTCDCGANNTTLIAPPRERLTDFSHLQAVVLAARPRHRRIGLALRTIIGKQEKAP